MNPALNLNAAILDRPDPRDYTWTEIGFGSPPFDWNTGFDIESILKIKIPTKDQGTSSSCGGQSWGYLAGVLEAVATGTYEDRSAKFIYSQTFVPPDGGSMGRDNAAIFVNQGVPRETFTSSYQNSLPPAEPFMRRVQDITDNARYDAKSSKSLSYASVDVSMGIDSIAQAIRDNFGVVLGITGQNNGTWVSEFPTPPNNQAGLWHHFIYAGKAKLVNGKKYIGCKNSWGNVGDNGWQYLPAEYFTKILPADPYGRAVWQVWTQIFAPPPIPVFSHNFTTNIAYGQSGPEVTALQRALQIDGEFPATVPCTGLYLNITRAAVLSFQLKYNIDSLVNLFDLNGMQVGSKTRMKLNQLFHTA